MDSTSRGPVRIDVPADTGITNSIDQQGADDQQRSPPRAHITSRRNVNAQRVAAFLKGILVGGARPVTELEAKARAAGLLGDRHHIGDAKAFKSAKRRLGITSRRDGFGRGGGGSWELPALSDTPTATAESPPCPSPVVRVSAICDRDRSPDISPSAEPPRSDQSRYARKRANFRF